MRLMTMFALVALVELATFVIVESWIGLANALLIALATAVVGSALVRRAGLAVMGDIRRRLDAGAMPGRELSHGAAVLVSGALLISPGFVTDLIGFLLLVPRVRDLVHERLVRRFAPQVTVITPGARRAGFGDDPDIIEVESWEVEEVDSD